MNKQPVSRIEYVKKNMISRVLYTIVCTLFPFFIRSALVRHLGEEYLGLNSFCTSMLEVINITNLGIDAAFQFNLYKPIADNDYEIINALIVFYRKAYRLIGMIMTVVGLIMLLFLKFLIKSDIPGGINIYFVFLVFLVSNNLSYMLFSAEHVFNNANQKAYVNVYVYLVSSIIFFCLQFVSILFSNYILYLVFYFCQYASYSICGTIITRFRHRDILSLRAKNIIPKELKNNILRETLNVAVYRIRDISRNSFDSIIISAMMGLKALARYQNYYMVMVVPITIRAIISTSVTASLGNYSAENNRDKTYEVFKTILFINITVSGYFAIVYLALIQDFIVIWVGSKSLLSSFVAGLFSIYIYILGVDDIMKMLRSVTGVWDKGKIAALIEMLFNLLLNIVLTYLIGISGIVLATLLTIVVIYLPYEVYIMSKYIFKGKTKETLLILFKNILWTVCTGVIVIFLCSMVPRIYFWRLCVKALICVFVPMFTFLICYGKSNLYISAMKNILASFGKRC